MMAFTNWLAEAFKSFSATDPFYTERLWAFHKLNQPAFIERQQEHYHNLRTILQLWTRQPYHSNISTHVFLPEEVDGYGHAIQAMTFTFVNGIWFPSDLDNAHQGIQLHRLTDLSLIQQQAVLAAYIDDIRSSEDLFLLLNRLLSQASYLLEVTSDRPKIVILQHIITGFAGHVVPQLMVRVGQASQVTIVENWYTVQNTIEPFVNNFTHILLEEAAQLAYHILYTNAPSCYQVNTLYSHQKDHSIFTHHTFAFEATMLRMHLRARINGSHARANLYGLSSLGAKEKAAHQIQVVHSAPHSLSKQHYKSILSGQSTGSFSGTIYLTPEAQQTNAYQTNNALILSDEAHHYAKPQLEIYADDVKCSHGATTGQLDNTQLFYLQSRGIAAPLAKRLLLEAFGSQIIGSVALTTLQDYLYDKLVAKLVKL